MKGTAPGWVAIKIESLPHEINQKAIKAHRRNEREQRFGRQSQWTEIRHGMVLRDWRLARDGMASDGIYLRWMEFI